MVFRFRRIREVFGAEEGTFLAIFGVSLVAFLGIVALSFDYGRIDATQSELQSFADEIALAAAGELDGKNNSITRATAAAANLVAETQTFGDQTQTQSGAALKTLDSNDYQLFFYDRLPALDTTSMSTLTALNTSTEQAKARYVRVEVYAHTVGLTFGAAFRALSGTNGAPVNTVSARAVAGFTQYACDTNPLFFCLPTTTSGSYTANGNIGKMINLRARGSNNASWTNGNFGFLDMSNVIVDPNGPCAGKTNTQLTYCLLAATGNLTKCYPLNTVTLDPGQNVGLADPAINARFDLFDNTLNSERNDPNYQPAPNVVKGVIPPTNPQGQVTGTGCVTRTGAQPSPNTVPLGRDTVTDSNVTGTNAARFGNGTWDRAGYVATNHSGVDPVTLAISKGWTPVGQAGTRWQIYNAEIFLSNTASSGYGGKLVKPSVTVPGGGETGLPFCANSKSADPYRRVLYAAGIDCATYGSQMNGSASGIPAQEFFEFFLTEPVGADLSARGSGNNYGNGNGNGSATNCDPAVSTCTSTSDSGIWAEIVGSGSAGAGGGGRAVFRDFVQLYR